MNKKRIYHSIEWLVALAACGYLVWRMATYDDYASLWAALRGMDRLQWGALMVCVALMPVNMAIEAWRWMTLIVHNAQCTMHNVSFREAQRQVYYSKLAGLITPWRLGEYPARAVIAIDEMSATDSLNERSQRELHDAIWSRVLSMGAVGSATMTAAIIVAGGIGLLAEWMNGDLGFGMDDFKLSYILTVVCVLVLLGVALYFAPRLLRRWAVLSHRLVVISIGQSLVRLLCWCVQLYLVLYALGGLGELGILDGLGKTAVYYLLVTVTPNVPVAEVGVRGAWAIWVFGSMNAALAGVLLWGINTLLPCIVWPFIRKGKK